MFGGHRLNGSLQRVETAAAAGLLPKAQRKEVGQPGGSVSAPPPSRAQQGKSGAHPDGLQRSTQQVQTHQRLQRLLPPTLQRLARSCHA